MTPQESQMLSDLVQRVQQTRLTEKDPEAEEMLERSLGSNPDALYILAQTVLVQNLALNQAQAQIDQLKQAPAQQPARSTSFLGGLLHRDQPQAAPPPPPPTAYAQPYPPQAYAPPASAPGYGAPPLVSSGPSFLRSAVTTAAGVAAGALAFQGIESLMHGFGQGGGYGVAELGGGGRPEETVINNYYDSPDPGREHLEQEAAYDDRPEADLQDASYDSPSRDDLSIENSDLDDSVFNDPGDDSGSGSDDSGLI